ncbi:MAG TPA: dihydropteroate synthase [Actinomycetota bacterium]|nr:dihydropteroate synthase [Actinomycetota bacterium]
MSAGGPRWRLAHARGELAGDGCAVMGIVNRTPDSFYDGGRMDLDAACRHALALVAQGADVLDVGAVKAGPGEDVTEREETARLLPLVEALAPRAGVPLSVETARPAVARRAFDAGAALLNDVSGLAEPGLAAEVARARGGLVVMHHGGQLRGRPRHPRYDDVVAEVRAAWDALARRAEAVGVAPDAIAVDPGLDFGKTTFHSLELVRRLDELTVGPRPVLVAPSRKDVVGETLDLPPAERLEGTLALVALSVAGGAAVVRVHDVAPAVRVVRMVEAVLGRRRPAAPARGLWD